MQPTNKKELIELINKNWMTHDGMWFYHCLQELGIEKTNKLNKAAISTLAPIEIQRLKRFLKLGNDPVDSFDRFKKFFKGAKELFIPDFMNVSLSFSEKNKIHWEFTPYQCFAYKGMVAAGVIDKYECGVIYRIECWIKNLGVSFNTIPQITTCIMRHCGRCSGEIYCDF